MSKCTIRISLDRAGGQYQAGEKIAGTVTVDVGDNCSCNQLTLDCEWHTTGKGDGDSAGQRGRVLFAGHWMGGRSYQYPFALEAPPGPFSYRGRVLSINWRLVAHADIAWGFNAKAERPFQLMPGGSRREVNFGPSFRDSNQQTGFRQRTQRLFTLLGMVCMIAGLVMTIATGSRWGNGEQGMPVSVGWFIGGLSNILLGGFFLFLGVRNRLAQWKLGFIDVQVLPRVVDRGGTVECKVRFRPRETVEIGRVTANLIGEECAVSDQGENQTTHRHALHDREAVQNFSRQVAAGESIFATFPWEVPPDAPPTFAAPHNSIEWKVRLRISVCGWPDWQETFPVTVRP